MKYISLPIIAILTGIDFLTKCLAINFVKPSSKPITVIPNLLEWKYLENTGASFGILENMSWIFITCTVVLSAVVLYLFFTYKKHNFFSYYAAVAIVAGGLGNLIDRIMYGYVVDFIHVMFFPYIFNFADALVVTGTISYIIFFIFYQDKDKKLKNETGCDNNE